MAVVSLSATLLQPLCAIIHHTWRRAVEGTGGPPRMCCRLDVVTKLYLNPAARVPHEIDISGKRLFPLAGDTIVETSADFQRDFYEQAVATKLSDGSTVTAYTTATSQLAAMLAAKPIYMLAPQLTGDALTNLGSSTEAPATAELKNGAALSATELTAGVKSASLDGVDDYIDTGWTTRTNLCTDPMVTHTLGVFSNNKPLWTVLNTASPVVENAGALGFSYPGAANENAFKMTASNTSPLLQNTITKYLPATAGVTYTFSALFRHIAAAARSYKIEVVFRNGAGEALETAKSSSGAYEPNTEITASVTATAPVGTELMNMVVRPLSTTATVGDIAFITRIMLEQSATLGSYTPTVAQLASGEAVWQGGANESATEVGAFARNAPRTYVGLYQRSTDTTTDQLFATSTNKLEGFFYIDETEKFRFRPGVGGGEILSGIVAQTAGVTQMYALVFDDPGNTRSIYTDGSLVAGPTAASETWATGLGTMLLGVRNKGSPSGQFGGLLLPFAVYGRALSAGEIAGIYSGVGA